MSTRYILHGGNAQDKNTKNNNFFKEILDDYPERANILLVQFAAVIEKQEIYKKRHIAQFEGVKEERELNYKLAIIEDFDKQLEWADVVYLCGSSGGGATTRLLNVLNKVANLQDKFTNKTIAGESAGANCLTSYCYSHSDGIIKGLGYVPVRLIAHYQTGDESIFLNLEAKEDNLYLQNYQFKIFRI